MLTPNRLAPVVGALLVLDLIWLAGVDLPVLLGRGPVSFLISKSWVEGCLLRPLILLGLAWWVSSTEGSPVPRFNTLIVGALIAAAFVELLQNIGPLFDLPTVGIAFLGLATAATYGLYVMAFLTIGGKPQGLSWLSFPLVAGYAALMFWILEVFEREADIVQVALAYVCVATLFVGTAWQRLLKKDNSNSALFAAGGTLLLLFSDSIRAISVFKFSNGFPLAEFLIMALFFLGHASLALSAKSLAEGDA